MEKDIQKMTALVNAVHYLKKSKEAFECMAIQFGGKKSTELSNKYVRHIKWMYHDWTTNHKLRQEVLEVMRDEWNSDVYEIDDISEMSKLLPSDQRAVIIEILKAILHGEKINIKKNETTD